MKEAVKNQSYKKVNSDFELNKKALEKKNIFNIFPVAGDERIATKMMASTLPLWKSCWSEANKMLEWSQAQRDMVLEDVNDLNFKSKLMFAELAIQFWNCEIEKLVMMAIELLDLNWRFQKILTLKEVRLLESAAARQEQDMERVILPSFSEPTPETMAHLQTLSKITKVDFASN